MNHILAGTKSGYLISVGIFFFFGIKLSLPAMIHSGIREAFLETLFLKKTVRGNFCNVRSEAFPDCFGILKDHHGT